MKQYILRPSDRCQSANAISKKSKPRTPREKKAPRPATSPPYGYRDQDEIYSRATRAQYLEFSHSSKRTQRCETSKQHGCTKQDRSSKQVGQSSGEQIRPSCSKASDPLLSSELSHHSQRSEQTQPSQHVKATQTSRHSIRNDEPIYIEDLDNMSSLELINEHRRVMGRRPISEGPGVAFVDYYEEMVTPPRSPSFASWPPVSAASAKRQTCCLPFARAKFILWALIPCVRRGEEKEKVHRLRIEPTDDGSDCDFDNESFSSYYASVDPVSEKYSDPSNYSSGNLTPEGSELGSRTRIPNSVNCERTRPATI